MYLNTYSTKKIKFIDTFLGFSDGEASQLISDTFKFQVHTWQSALLAKRLESSHFTVYCFPISDRKVTCF